MDWFKAPELVGSSDEDTTALEMFQDKYFSQQSIFFNLSQPNQPLANVRYRQNILKELLNNPKLRKELTSKRDKLQSLRDTISQSYTRVDIGRGNQMKLISVPIQEKRDELKETFMTTLDGLVNTLGKVKSPGFRNLQTELQYLISDERRLKWQNVEENNSQLNLESLMVVDFNSDFGTVRNVEHLGFIPSEAYAAIRANSKAPLSLKVGDDEFPLVGQNVSGKIDGVKSNQKTFLKKQYVLIDFYEGLDASIRTAEDALSGFSFYEDCVKYVAELKAAKIPFSFPSFSKSAGHFRFTQAYPVWLKTQSGADFIPYDELIPNDLNLTPEKFVSNVTGQTNGGKSTFLRMAELFAELAYVGIPLPSRTSYLSPITNIRSSFVSNDGNQLSKFQSQSVDAIDLLEEITGSGELIILDESFYGADAASQTEGYRRLNYGLQLGQNRAFLSMHQPNAAREMRGDTNSFPHLQFRCVSKGKKGKVTYGISESYGEQTLDDVGFTYDGIAEIVSKRDNQPKKSDNDF